MISSAFTTSTAAAFAVLATLPLFCRASTSGIARRSCGRLQSLQAHRQDREFGGDLAAFFREKTTRGDGCHRLHPCPASSPQNGAPRVFLGNNGVSRHHHHHNSSAHDDADCDRSVQQARARHDVTHVYVASAFGRPPTQRQNPSPRRHRTLLGQYEVPHRCSIQAQLLDGGGLVQYRARGGVLAQLPDDGSSLSSSRACHSNHCLRTARVHGSVARSLHARNQVQDSDDHHSSSHRHQNLRGPLYNYVAVHYSRNLSTRGRMYRDSDHKLRIGHHNLYNAYPLPRHRVLTSLNQISHQLRLVHRDEGDAHYAHGGGPSRGRSFQLGAAQSHAIRASYALAPS